MKNIFIKLNSKNRRIKTRNLAGFTLIESLISTTLFSFVAFVATVSLFSMYTLNNKIRVSKKVYDNVYLSLDSITRDLKQSSNYENVDYHDSNNGDPCEGDAKSCVSFDYLNLSPDNVANPAEQRGYFLENGKIYRYVGKNNNALIESVTSDEININSLTFDIMRQDDINFPYRHPHVKVIIKGETKFRPTVQIYLDNLVSSRVEQN